MGKCKNWVGTKNAKKRVLIGGGGYFALGCLMVWNKKLNEIATYMPKEKIIGKKISHDQWLGIIAVYFGNVVYDDFLSIFHIRHDNSVTNSGKKVKLTKRMHMKYAPYAQVLYEGYKNTKLLSKEDLEYLKRVAFYKKSIKNRIGLVIDKQFISSSIMGTIRLKIALLIGKY